MVVNLAWGPKVYLVGRQTVGDAELERFLADEGVESWETDTEVAGQKLSEVAGRVCYMSFARPRPGGNASYLGHILESGHGSVLEHAVFSLVFTGVSRSLTHELVRHRAGMSYSQLSQRYVDESECEFVVPPALEEEVRLGRDYLRLRGDDCNLAWLHATRDMRPDDPTMIGLKWVFVMEHTRRAYSDLSDYLTAKNNTGDRTADRKAAREAARSVLPNSTGTKIFVTMNARAARHFVEMRGHAAADAEIRRLAYEALRVLTDAAPGLFGDISPSPGDGSLATPFRKV